MDYMDNVDIKWDFKLPPEDSRNWIFHDLYMKLHEFT